MKDLQGWTPVDFMVDDPNYADAMSELQNAIDQAAADQEDNYEGRTQ